MPVRQSISPDGHTVTLAIDGRFDFSVHREFRAALDAVSGQPVHDWVVDLGGTQYIDSSALGMLLVLRKSTAGRPGGAVRIVNARAHVRRVMEIANFQRMFEIA
jgi:anti-anti-sigma factor